jgi:putative NADH-flavin reductase
VADVLDPAAIGTALAGADAVISVLGPRSYRTASSIISAGTASILAAMGAAGTSRLVVTSAAPVASDDHGTTVAYRLLVGPMLRALLRRGYADMAVMEEAVRRSGVDWTILRPPRLTDGRRTGTWRQATNANLISALVGQGHTVIALARTPAKAAAQGATAVSVSIFDRSALAAVFAGMDAVVNLTSAIPPMTRFLWARRGGTITASPARLAIALTGGFGVACAAIEGLSRTLAAELGPQGVRVVCMRAHRIGDSGFGADFPMGEDEFRRSWRG